MGRGQVGPPLWAQFNPKPPVNSVSWTFLTLGAAVTYLMEAGLSPQNSDYPECLSSELGPVGPHGGAPSRRRSAARSGAVRPSAPVPPSPTPGICRALVKMPEGCPSTLVPGPRPVTTALARPSGLLVSPAPFCPPCFPSSRKLLRGPRSRPPGSPSPRNGPARSVLRCRERRTYRRYFGGFLPVAQVLPALDRPSADQGH